MGEQDVWLSFFLASLPSFLRPPRHPSYHRTMLRLSLPPIRQRGRDRVRRTEEEEEATSVPGPPTLFSADLPFDNFPRSFHSFSLLHCSVIVIYPDEFMNLTPWNFYYV